VGSLQSNSLKRGEGDQRRVRQERQKQQRAKYTAERSERISYWLSENKEEIHSEQRKLSKQREREAHITGPLTSIMSLPIASFWFR
jgi:hypothetical protein